jgi:GNAT superfamily N-acetyltransferase
MPTSSAAQSDQAIRYVTAKADDDAIEDAIELGNLSRDTLGQLNFAAYHEAAANGTLLLAYRADHLVGYALYALAKGRVRLVHLCVHPDFRLQGIGRAMVSEISAKHAAYRGISARCRHDYDISRVWIRLGFTNINERAGRGKNAEPLTDWWLDHNHPNLFTLDTESVLVRAAIDLNILRDLAEKTRADRDESLSLRADHLNGQLQLVRTAALDQEIATMTGDLRGLCARTAEPLTSVRADPANVAEVELRLLEHARRINSNYPRNGNEQFDLDHVANTVAAGLNVFITKDAELTNTLGAGAADMGLRIMRPSDVIIHIDELSHAESYRPAELLNTGYARRLVGSGEEEDLRPLVNTRGGERPRQLLQVMRRMAQDQHERMGIYGPDGTLVAVYGLSRESGVLGVPVLRVIDKPIGQTLARQVLFLLRQRARDEGLPVLRLSDAFLPAPVRTAAVSDGFHEAESDLVAYVLPAVGAAAEVEHEAVRAARQAGIVEPAPLRSGMPSVVAAELERAWWPAKIVDSQIPTYMIPIRQAYSAELLGVPSSLLHRQDLLGLSREHVYYRSPRGLGMSAPARLLWYMSTGGQTRAVPAGIIACSELDSVIVGEPDDLYSRFRHLGVWNRDTILAASHDGRAQALRFTNTEVFPTAVPRKRMLQIMKSYGVNAAAPQSPTTISSALFAALYQEGRM